MTRWTCTQVLLRYIRKHIDACWHFEFDKQRKSVNKTKKFSSLLEVRACARWSALTHSFVSPHFNNCLWKPNNQPFFFNFDSHNCKVTYYLPKMFSITFKPLKHTCISILLRFCIHLRESLVTLLSSDKFNCTDCITKKSLNKLKDSSFTVACNKMWCLCLQIATLHHHHYTILLQDFEFSNRTELSLGGYLISV